MRWRGQRESQNVEDRRGQGGGGFPFPGGGMRFPSGCGGGRGGGIGIVGFLIILGLMLFFGVDPRVILQGPSGSETTFPDIHLPQQRIASQTETEQPCAQAGLTRVDGRSARLRRVARADLT